MIDLIVTAKTSTEECRYCGGGCPNEPDDSEYLCDGYSGDIDGLYSGASESYVFHNENARYFKVRGNVDIGDGEQWHIMLFTESEVSRGISRAESHPDDLW